MIILKVIDAESPIVIFLGTIRRRAFRCNTGMKSIEIKVIIVVPNLKSSSNFMVTFYVQSKMQNSCFLEIIGQLYIASCWYYMRKMNKINVQSTDIMVD